MIQVTVPRLSEVTEEDRKNRVLRPVRFTVPMPQPEVSPALLAELIVRGIVALQLKDSNE